MSHETRGPKYNRQEPVGSMYDCLVLISKDTCQKSNHQETIGSTLDRLTFLLKKIRIVFTHNKIAAPFVNNTHKIDITKYCNSMHLK